ncbi:efflux transporter periplasmic adaptor subunit [Myxococcus xanthus]|uniref:efflux RND transporter periplasmic adaptor subunit n=1 Tax=Myxococcus xanthus TaxID=34 RepID=UPI00112B5889|nr:efflux RND transporter periplasmic adaptor subunit [Myxococcus xanthus]QDE91022.1 efflux transporter periplasmic adaptor subunit [Myxococcus xanthus]
MSKTKKWIISGSAALLLGAGVYVTQRGEEPKTNERSAAVAVVERRDMEVVAESAGLVEPLRVVEVKSQASGEVLKVHYDTGDTVAEGTLLAEIEPRDVQNALAQAQADLESARVRLNTTEAQRQRMEALRKDGYVTQQEYETAVDASATARATKVRAETNLQLARERSRDVTIIARSPGTILERTIQPGVIIASATNNVSGGTALFKMADLSVMQVRAKVDETDVGQIKPGQKARVTMEAYPGRTFIGEVVKIEPQALVEQNVTLFPVLVRMDNPDGLLRPGMNAEVAIEISRRRNALTVPNTAVVGVRDARSAAAAVGVSEEALRAVMRPPGAPNRPGAPSGPTTVSAVGEAGVGATAAVAHGAGPGAVPARGQGGMGEGQGGGGQGRAGRRAREDVQGATDTRQGVVFVQSPTGPQPRRVTLGLSDWESTEVVSGLEDGEQVVLITVAKLQKQQQQSAERMRQMSGGVIPGAGGGPRGPR